ncbi:MAG: hypothetical protein FGM32_02180 [Candidatus Kapabacteria bacterium]|nr:hypothetical protein [Candidatus Kapabacteria bacterium]
MELLIAILTWLGLMTSGTQYTDADIQRIAAENRAVVNARKADVLQANGGVPDILTEEIILYK